MNKHRVEYDGLVFSRNSKSRKYSHVVLRPSSLAGALNNAEASARYDWRANKEWHEARAEKRNPSVAKFPELYPPERIEKEAAESRAWLDGGLDALLLAGRKRALENWRHCYPDRDNGWYVVGWCGRADLARKLADVGGGDVILEVAP